MWDTECDHVQPFYLLDEESVYPSPFCRLPSSENVWEKFELPPTPPGSPPCPPLQSCIIHDCMWSSSSPVTQRLLAGWGGTTEAAETGPCVQKDHQGSPQEFHCTHPTNVLPLDELESPPPSCSEAESDCAVSADSLPLVLKSSHINSLQHNYAARKRPTERRRQQHKVSGDKRSNHNVLERRRRTQLSRSFVSLREQIPAVAEEERAAKVEILQQAAELIRDMEAQQSRMQREEQQLRRRSRELKRRREQLQTVQ